MRFTLFFLNNLPKVTLIWSVCMMYQEVLMTFKQIENGTVE
jgi:hypothetical protein